MKFVAFAGSLRKDSLNKKLINSLKSIFPDDHELIVLEINDIPLYNQDLEPDNIPQSVTIFAQECANADGFLISTPEYNGGISGVLKNTLDWLSRKSVGAPLQQKTVGLMGATPGQYGTAAAYEELKNLVTNLGMMPVVTEKIRISKAHEKFDQEGNLFDEKTINILKTLIDKLINLTTKLK